MIHGALAAFCLALPIILSLLMGKMVWRYMPRAAKIAFALGVATATLSVAAALFLGKDVGFVPLVVPQGIALGAVLVTIWRVVFSREGV